MNLAAQSPLRDITSNYILWHHRQEMIPGQKHPILLSSNYHCLASEWKAIHELKHSSVEMVNDRESSQQVCSYCIVILNRRKGLKVEEGWFGKEADAHDWLPDCYRKLQTKRRWLKAKASQLCSVGGATISFLCVGDEEKGATEAYEIPVIINSTRVHKYKEQSRSVTETLRAKS